MRGVVRNPGFLALQLLKAGRWFDEKLLDGLAAKGWPRLTGPQSQLFARLDREGTPPAELARRLGTTRQSTQDLVGGLERLGLLEVIDDPSRRRGRLVRLTPDGRRIARDARQLLVELEARLDPEQVRALGELLDRMFGSVEKAASAPSDRGAEPRDS